MSVARFEQPDTYLKSENVDEQGGLVLLTSKSDHKLLQRKAGNWGHPSGSDKTTAHRKIRRIKYNA